MSIAAPTLSPRTLSRDDIVRLGQAGRPWEFLPVAVQALRQAPDDYGLRLITSANLVRLGLKTAAGDHLACLPAQIVRSPEVDGLARVIRGMPSDVIEPAERVALARANLEALGDRRPRVDLEAWARGAGEVVFCRASDGNVVSRPASGAAETWRGVSDQRSGAARLVREHFQPGRPDSSRPVYIEGVDPPWLLVQLAAARPREQTGYLAPITIVQAEERQFLDGLSLVDLRAALGAGNVTALVGPDATIRLGEQLRERAAYQITGAGLTSVATREKLSPAMSEVLAEGTRQQEAMMAELTARAAEAYPARAAAWWRDRFAQALSGGEPLRVLIPTTRYSTFVQHASRDLARTIESLGHRAKVMIEPDDSTKFAATAYLSEILEFGPDLVLNINYPRALLAEAVPANVPFVCWIQDAMPHLFSPTVGAAQGPLDFVVGHLFEELFERHNYPRERAMGAAIVADEAKFHATPIHASARAKFECEIAFVSHQSETPEAQHQRLRAEFSAKVPVGGALDRLRPLLEREAFKPLSDLRTVELRDLAMAALRDELKRDPDARVVDIVVRSYCQPHIDRLIRHQTLEWAADVAERRAWRLKLYGKGWESHPRLAKYAAGPLDHGDDLRASYQASGVHLHMMAHALVHQRLIECVLSGGFPMCRLHAPERWAITETLSRQGVCEGATPLDVMDESVPRGRRVVSWADAPSLMHLASALQRLGLLEEVVAPVQGRRCGPLINEMEWVNPGALKAHDPDLWSAFGLLGSSEHFMFHSRETLEARVAWVLENRDQRVALSSAARRRFEGRFTYSAFAKRLLAFIQEGLGPTT